MFFVLSKVLIFLISPLNWIIALFSASFVVKNKKRSKQLKLVSFIFLLFFSNPLASNIAMRNWEVSPIPYKNFSTYEYGILLTGITSPDRYPKDRIHYQKGADRVLHTIQLYKQGIIKKIVITGGNSSIILNYPAEADRLAKTIILAGIPTSDLIIESSAQNTAENAINTRKLLPYSNDILLITSAFHMIRARACFEKQGFNVTVFSTDLYSKPLKWTFSETISPKIEALNIWNILIKEWIGMIVYKTKGYI